jgi:hypothetical protein
MFFFIQNMENESLHGTYMHQNGERFDAIKPNLWRCSYSD